MRRTRGWTDSADCWGSALETAVAEDRRIRVSIPGKPPRADNPTHFQHSHLADLGWRGLGWWGRGHCYGCGRRLGLELRGRGHWEVLHRDALRCNVVDLSWRGDIDQVVGLNLDLVARRQESVEAHDEIWVALEKLGHPADHPRSVDAGDTGTQDATRVCQF